MLVVSIQMMQGHGLVIIKQALDEQHVRLQMDSLSSGSS